MIAVGTQAPDFKLLDQFGRAVELKELLKRGHVLVASYPLDWTPT